MKSLAATQCDLVLNHLTRYRRITSQVAWKRYSITRLSDVVFKLKRRGHAIRTQLCQFSQHGRVTRYAEYQM